MAKSTTDIIVDLNLFLNKKSQSGDFEGASLLTENPDGSYVVEQTDLNYDFAGATELQAGVDAFNAAHAAPADEPSYSDYIKFKYKKGKAPLIRGAFGTAAIRGEISFDEAIKKGDKEYLDQLEKAGKLEDLNFSEAPVKVMLGEAAQILPFMIESVTAGLKAGIIMGGGFAGLGALSAPPVAPVTIPLTFATGVATGMGFGVVKTAMDIEGGNLVLDLVKAGISEKTAVPLAVAAGMAIGLIELTQLRLFAAPFKRKFVKVIFSKVGKSAILASFTAYFKILGMQVAQEDLQEMVQIATEIIAGLVENNPNVIPDTDQILDRLVQTTVKSAQGLAVLGLSGAVAVGVQARSLTKEQRLTAVKQAFAAEEMAKGEEKVTVRVEKLEEITEVEKPERGVEEFKKEEKDGKPQAQKAKTEEVIPKLKGLAEGVIPLSTEIVIKRKDISGRITKLDSEVKQVDKDIDALQKQKEEAAGAAGAIIGVEIKALEKEIKGKKSAGKSFAALETRLDKKQSDLTNITSEKFDKAIEQKLAERDVLDEERAGLIIAEDLTRIDVSGKRVELSANEVKAFQTQIVKNKIRDVQNGIKKGKQIARAEIKDILNTLSSIIIASEANETQKIQALKAIQGIQTQEQFEKAAPSLLRRVDRAAETFNRKKLIDSFKKMTKIKIIDKLSPDIKKAITNILDEFSAVKPSKKKLDAFNTLADKLVEMEGNQLTDDIILQIVKFQKKNLSEMSLEDVQLVHDSVAHLLKLNKEENTIRVENRAMEKEAVITEASENVSKRFGELDGSVDGMDSTQIAKESKLAKTTKALKTFLGVESYNMELVSEILDGKDNGIIQKIFYRGIDNGEAKALAFRHFAEDFFIQRGVRGVIDDNWSAFFTKKEKKLNKVKVNIEAGTITMTKGDRVSFLLHMKNDNSRRHLLEGGFVFRKHFKKDATKLTENDLTTIAESATAQEVLVADAIHEYFNTIQKQSINETSVSLLGFEIAIEPNYFPIQVSRLALEQREKIKDFDDTGKFIEITLEGMGIFKKRTRSSAPIYISDAFEVVQDNIQKASSYIGLAEPLRNAKSLFTSKKFQKSMGDAGLESYLKVIQNYLRRIEGESTRNDNADKLTQNWINKLDVAILGGNPYIWMKQPVSYLLAATEMDGKYIASSFSFRIPKEQLIRMKKWSTHIRDRFEGNVSRETGEVASIGRTRRFFTGKEVISNKLMKGLRKFDEAAIGSLWRAVEKETKDKHSELKGDAFNIKVAERTWEVIRRTQPTFAIKDRSTIGMSKNTWWRLATKYSSQRNKNWMIMRRAFEQYNRSEKTIKDKALLTKRIVLIRIIAPALIAGINVVAATGRRDKDEEDKLTKVFLIDWLKTTLGDIYFLSPIISEIIGQIEKGKGQGFGLTDPLTSEFEVGVKAVVGIVDEIGKIFSQDNYKKGRKKGEAEWKAGLPSWFLDSLDVSSKVSGYPIHGYLKFLLLTKNQINKALDFKDNTDTIQNDRF